MNWIGWLFVASGSLVILGIVIWPARQRSPQDLLDEVNREERARRGI